MQGIPVRSRHKTPVNMTIAYCIDVKPARNYYDDDDSAARGMHHRTVEGSELCLRQDSTYLPRITGFSTPTANRTVYQLIFGS